MVSKEEYGELLQMFEDLRENIGTLEDTLLDIQTFERENNKLLKSIVDQFLEIEKEKEGLQEVHSETKPESRSTLYSVSPKPCRKCGGLISWDEYPDNKFPVHVDERGEIVGDGDCPMYKKEG